MKSLLFIMAAFFFTLSVNAQGTQTEDEVYIGKGKTFGNYKRSDTKPINGQLALTGTVVSGCKRDCCNKKQTSCSFNLLKDDGTILTVGTTDFEFTVPKELIGKRIIVEGVDVTTSYIRRRKTINQNYQKDIQFAATGIKIN